MIKIHQHAKFHAILSMRSPGNARKPQIWPVSLSQSGANRRKSTDSDHNLISSESGQDTSACKISGHTLHAFSSKCPEISLDGWTDRWMDGRTRRKMVTVGQMDRRTHVQVERGYFRLRTNRGTDGQMDNPKNIMPPAPKDGGIKMNPVSKGLNRSSSKCSRLFLVS